MPIFKTSTEIELVRNVRLSFRAEAALRGLGSVIARFRSRSASTPAKLAERERVRQQLESKDREITRLEAQLVADTTVKPGNMVWVFGSGRTGSSWLTSMMADLEGHARWNEPYVGELFGTAYYVRVGDQMRGCEDFVLGDSHREAWIGSIRNFVLEGANVRFPEMAPDGYLVVKEPNGSMGAPLLMEALPESRMVLLVRDPRDVASSALAANREGSWGGQWRADGSASLADTDPHEFVRQWANMYMVSLGKAREAYKAHEGHKVVVRYEDLRYQTFETMKRLYSELGVPVDDGQLRRVVEKHAWENVPEEKKGADKPHRKATPGGWEQDLTPEQARVVEEKAAPILDEFYPGWSALSDEARDKIAQVSHWYHRIRVAPGVVTPGVNDSDAVLEAMKVPRQLDGMRVLDVGAHDGYFSFVAEQRGAEVLAIDSLAPHVTGFAVASSLVGSSVEYRMLNVYDLDPKNVGTFDMIFFLGVLYHLRDPMLALDRLREVARPGATIWVESHIMDQGLADPKTGELKNLSAVAPELADVPMAQFYPGDLLLEGSNWWGPNLAGLKAMVEAAGFEVLRSRFAGNRGLIFARRTEDPETSFFREFDRSDMTGEEGMVWHNSQQWGSLGQRGESPPASRGSPSPTDEAREAVSGVEHWYHRIEVAPGVVTPGFHDSDAALEAMELPERLDGMRVLDVGARDGYFSFAAERRGAEVLAIDSVAPEHLGSFATASALLGSAVEYRTMNVYDVNPENAGTFDAIFFLGVLYQLRAPMLALDRLWGVARPGATIWVESHTIDGGFVDPTTNELKPLSAVAPKLADVPMAQFYPGDLLVGNFTNWWGPNLAGLKAMVEAAGFEVLRSRLIGSRGLVVGRKTEDRETIFFRDLDRRVIEDREIISFRDFNRRAG